MKRSLLCSILFIGISTTSTFADWLPSLDDKGWTSSYAGFVGSGFEISVNTAGELQLFFTPRKNERLNNSWPIDTEIRIERREKGKDKWVLKKTSLEGFTTSGEVKLGQKEVDYEATVTGGAKFKVKYTFDKNGVNIFAEMPNKPEDADEADYRLIFRCDMPQLVQSSTNYNEKELKAKTRGDEIRIEFQKEDKQKIRGYEKADDTKINSSLPVSIMLNADKIGRKKLTWSLIDPKDTSGFELDFKSQTNLFVDGVKLRATLLDETGIQQTKGIRLECK